MSGRAIRLFAVTVLAVGSHAAEVEVAGVPNFHTVNEHLYRGGHPSHQGLEGLAKLGVKTVIDLREGDDREGAVVEQLGMRYFRVPMAGLGAPTDKQVSSVLRVFDDGASWPVFVHCKRGADRTGTVVACYRITHDHWQNEKALDEAKIHGMSRLERAMQHYIMAFKPNLPQITDPAVAVSQNKEVQ